MLFNSTRRDLLKFLSSATILTPALAKNTIGEIEKGPDIQDGLIKVAPIETLLALNKMDAYNRHMMDIVPWILYDRVKVPSKLDTRVDSYNLFSIPIGQPCPYGGNSYRTLIDTNMNMSNLLPLPQFFAIQSIYALTHPRMSDIAYDSLAEYWYELWIGQKIYAEGPIPFVRNIGEILPSDNYKSKAKVLGIANNQISFSSISSLHIPQGVHFSVRLGSYKPLRIPGLDMWFCLDGIMARGIQ